MTSAEVLDVSEPTPIQMRAAMSRFASGVTVVTGVDGAEAVGFTCQSFASVSLDPPLVLFCADHSGRTWPKIRNTGRFCVNVLAEPQADLCGRFGSRWGLRYAGLPWQLSRWGTPELPDVLLRVHAEVHDVHSAGDHDVVIGRVLELDHSDDHRPMIFYRGGFGIEQERDAEAALAAGWGWGDRWG